MLNVAQLEDDIYKIMQGTFATISAKNGNVSITPDGKIEVGELKFVKMDDKLARAIARGVAQGVVKALWVDAQTLCAMGTGTIK